MSKHYIYIVCMLLSVILVSAKIELETIAMYVNDDKVSGIDEDGGDIDVIQGDDIEVNMRLENTENVSISVTVEGRINDIDNGDDITKDTTKTIEAEDDKSIRLFFGVPNDAESNDYELEIDVKYSFNGSNEKLVYDNYIIDVKENVEEKEVNLKTSFDNLTKVCTKIVGTMDNCFGYVGRHDNCTGDLASCREERGKYQTESQDCTETLNECKQERSNYETERNKIQAQLDSRPTWANCNNNTRSKVRDAERSKDNMYLGIIGVGVLGYVFFTKKKKKETVSGYYEHEQR